jgi:hypothetical protein
VADSNIYRRLRGALGNALVWGVGWFAAGLAKFATLSVAGVITLPWKVVLESAGRARIVGGIAGGAYSGVIRLVYHGRSLSDISWMRFGIVAGVVTGLFVPLFFQTMNLLFGGGQVPWELVLDDAPIAAVLGGAVAGGSLALARMAEKRELLDAGADVV